MLNSSLRGLGGCAILAALYNGGLLSWNDLLPETYGLGRNLSQSRAGTISLVS